MADLPYIDRDSEVKIVGQDTTGLRVNYVGADANGNLQVINYSSGSVTGGTAATVSSLAGGIYNTSFPTLTNGQQSAVQVDSSGRLIISPVGTLAVGVADRTAFVYGTTLELPVGGVYNDSSPTLSTGTTGTFRLNVNRAIHSTLRDPTTDVGVTTTPINSEQRLDVNTASEGTNGSATPFQTIQVGGSDGTDLRTIATDAAGRLKLAASSYFHPIYTAKVQSVAAVTSVLSTSVAATITATKAGNTIIVAACCNAGTLTIADSASQSYSTATTIAGNGTQTSKIFYFPNTAAGVTTVTISSTSSTDLNLIVTEYSGILTVSPLDQTSTHGQTASASWTSNSTSTTAQASELLIGSCMGTLHMNDVFTGGTNWNSIATQNSTRGGSNLGLFMADQNVSATGTHAFTGTITGNPNDDLYAAIATFKFVTPNMIIAVNSAATIKSGSGILRKIVLNTVGTGSASVSVYDNTTNSGTVIANTSLTTAIGSFDYNLNFSTGLTIVINSSTPDFTVIYD